MQETQIERLTADNAALLEYVAATVEYLEGNTDACADRNCECLECDGRRKLAQPHPGAKLLGELAALRAVKDAAQADQESRQHGMDCPDSCMTLTEAIAAYAIRNREGS